VPSNTSISSAPTTLHQGACKPVGLAEFRKALNASKVLPSIKTTLLQFAKYANTERGNCIFPGNKRIATDLGVCELTVKRHTKWAQANGWMLLVHSGRGGYPALRHASIWQLSVPIKVTSSKYQNEPTTPSITASAPPAESSPPQNQWPAGRDVAYYGDRWHCDEVDEKKGWHLLPPEWAAEVMSKWMTLEDRQRAGGVTVLDYA